MSLVVKTTDVAHTSFQEQNHEVLSSESSINNVKKILTILTPPPFSNILTFIATKVYTLSL